MSNQRESPRINKSFYSDDNSYLTDITKNKFAIKSSIFIKKNIENDLFCNKEEERFFTKMNKSLIKKKNKNNKILKFKENDSLEKYSNNLDSFIFEKELNFKKRYIEKQLIKTNKEEFEIIFDNQDLDIIKKENNYKNECDKNRYDICLCKELQCLIQ